MEMALKTHAFVDLDDQEMMDVDGGGVVAAVYALGFVFGCSPLGALCICAGVAVAAAAGGWAVSRYCK